MAFNILYSRQTVIDSKVDHNCKTECEFSKGCTREKFYHRSDWFTAEFLSKILQKFKMATSPGSTFVDAKTGQKLF